MTQFDLHRNAKPITREILPLVRDVPSDGLEDLRTRVVIPLTPSQTRSRNPLETLTPAIGVSGTRYILVTLQPAGIPQRDPGPRMAAIPEERLKIMAAMGSAHRGPLTPIRDIQMSPFSDVYRLAKV